MSTTDVLNSFSQLLGEKVLAKIDFRGETTFVISAANVREIAKFCRDDLSFDYLLDISSVDNPENEPRFEMVYELYSMTLPFHLRLKLIVSKSARAVDTVSHLWPTANWH